MSLMQFLRILIARRWIILISLVTCVVVATGVAAVLPKRYTAKARILMDTVRPDPITGQLIATNAMRGYTRTQMELIQDYKVAGDVVDKLGWQQNPAFVAQWQSDTGGQTDFRRWAAQRIIDGTSTDLVENSAILEISYQGPSPDVAKAIASALRESFIDASLRLRTDAAGRTGVWYKEQADKAQKSLAASEAAVSKFQEDNGIVAVAGGEAETVKLQGLEQAVTAARNGLGQAQMAAASQASGNGGIVDKLKGEVAQLNDQVEQAGEKFGTSHPGYKALIARRDLMESELHREESAAKANAGLLTGGTQKNAATLEAAYNAQKAKVLAMRPQLDQLAQLEREVAQRKTQYDKAAQRTADLKLEADVSETGLVVLGDAIADRNPSYPKLPLIAGLATAFGLGLGLVLALFTEMLARRVRGAEDLAFASKVPVLAVIAGKPPLTLRERATALLSRRQPETPDWQPAQ